MSRIWRNHMLLEILKVFLLFILGFYFLYILIDYSSRMDAFSNLPFSAIAAYYGCVLSQKSEILIPFAFLITSTKVLLTLNHNNEFVSMLMAGISFKKLLSPLFIFAAFLTVALFLNFEFFEPYAQKKIELIKQVKKSKKEQKIRSYVLEDQSKLVFKSYDFSKKTLNQVYWLTNSDHIYYMDQLDPYKNPPIGQKVLTFKKDESSHALSLVSQNDAHTFNEMKLDFNPLVQSIFSEKIYPISQLYKNLHGANPSLNMNRASLLTAFNYKLALPFLPLCILISLAPICTRFSRNIPSFLIYMGAIALLLSFYTLMDACYILGENQLMPPKYLIWMPFLIYFAYPIKRFYRY